MTILPEKTEKVGEGRLSFSLFSGAEWQKNE